MSEGLSPPQASAMDGVALMAKMVDWALMYSGQGFAVFPLHGIASGRCTCGVAECDSAGKHPRWDADLLPLGLHSASKDERKIRTWWTRWPNANIAIATGLVSGVVVVDIDGPKGVDSMKMLQRRHGKLQPTRVHQTGKGAHLLYRVTRAAVKNQTGMVPGVDVRGEGGYIVAPPSLHASGARYRTSRAVEMDAPPLWLRKMLVKRPRSVPVEHGRPRTYMRARPHKRVSDFPDIGEGGRNHALFDMASRWAWELLWTDGELESMIREANATKCKPPLRDREVTNVTRKILRMAARDRAKNPQQPVERQGAGPTQTPRPPHTHRRG